MPWVMARSIFMVPVVSDASRNCSAHWTRFQPDNGSQGAVEIGEVVVGIAERICPRVFLKRIFRQRGLEMFQVTVLSKRSSEVVPSKVAMATELSNGSCSQRKRAGFGVMVSLSRSTAGHDSREAGTSCGVRPGRRPRE